MRSTAGLPGAGLHGPNMIHRLSGPPGPPRAAAAQAGAGPSLSGLAGV